MYGLDRGFQDAAEGFESRVARPKGIQPAGVRDFGNRHPLFSHVAPSTPRGSGGRDA